MGLINTISVDWNHQDSLLPATNGSIASFFFPFSLLIVLFFAPAFSGCDLSQSDSPSNTAPVAFDQAVTTAQDTAVTITLPATDVNEDILDYLVVSAPSNGTVATSGAEATYTPNAAYSGDDSFTFTASDGLAVSNTATVSITVTPPDKPRAHLTAVPAKGAIGLEWPPVAGAEGYNIYWATTAGVTTTGATLIENVESGYLHTGLTNGTSYYYAVTVLTGAVEGELSPEISASPGGEFELYRLGTGRIPAVVNNDLLSIPVEERIHVILLPEGYLAAEIQMGVFDADIAYWHRGLFALDPYKEFSEAFVIWKLPTPSNEHIAQTDPQTADTAFRVPVSLGGIGTIPQTGETSQRVWTALKTFPFPPGTVLSTVGRTKYILKNLMVHLLVLRPETVHSGFSGRVRLLENPNDTTQRIFAAFAHDLAHEFSHALGFLKDEYMNTSTPNYGIDNAQATSSPYLSNLVTESACDTLPWKHLLYGAEFNPFTDQLVGAFGDSSIGFHSEFTCLMNGRHDNALFFGGSGWQRVQRLCNFDRELVTFRILERLNIFTDSDTSWDLWSTDYRSNFYAQFGFFVPEVVPQTNSVGTAWFEACTP